MMEDGETGTQIVARAIAHLRGQIPMALVALLLLTAIDSLGDFMPEGQAGLAAISVIASIAVQALVTQRLLYDLRLIRPDVGTGRLVGVFGVSLLSGAAILLGLFFLVVPGIVLMVRWSAAVPALVAEGVGPIQALRRSWEETKGRFGPILRAYVIAYGPMLVVIGVMIWQEGLSAYPPFFILFNLITVASQLLGWVVAVVVYAAVTRRDELGEVFA